MARIKLSDLYNPEGKARRWDGSGFNAAYTGVGMPIPSLQIPVEEGGGAALKTDQYHWGPSVSWNYYLNCYQDWDSIFWGTISLHFVMFNGDNYVIDYTTDFQLHQL